MIEFSPSDFMYTAPVFQRMADCIPLQGLLKGQHPARLFCDAHESPTCAFAWTGWGYFYLAGDTANAAFASDLRRLLDEELLPASYALGQSGFILWPDVLAWENRLADILPGRTPFKIYRRTFQFDPVTYYEGRYSRPALPAGFTFDSIDCETLAGDERLASEVLAAWRSTDDFLESGLGVCLCQGKTPVSTCISLFLADGAAEISIYTNEEYRQRGFAILTADRFIDACLKRGLRPNWECFWDNVPSVRLAENLGFKAQGDVSVYYWEEPDSHVKI
jgi:RimJ/RimL family protein N-acetyltransferase